MLAQLQALNLPQLLPREQMLEQMLTQVYGHLPPPPTGLTFIREPLNAPTFGGKASCTKVTALCSLCGRDFSFPFHAVIPTAPGRHPFFVHINFRPEVADYYQPIEEIIDSGFAVLSFDYNDVTRDDGDFTHGLAGVLFPGGSRAPADPGKIAMWAWAAHRVMDFAEKCALLRKYYEMPAIMTDIIAGFPGETEEEFSETLRFVSEIRFSRTHIFKYSVRCRRAAYISEADKKDACYLLITHTVIIFNFHWFTL